MTSLDPEEADLFETFRVLRERVFEGSDAFRQRVIKGVEHHLSAQPEEPFATALLVHAVNFLASWLVPERAEPAEEDDDQDPPR
jgi:hypothetical protein